MHNLWARTRALRGSAHGPDHRDHLAARTHAVAQSELPVQYSWEALMVGLLKGARRSNPAAVLKFPGLFAAALR